MAHSSHRRAFLKVTASASLLPSLAAKASLDAKPVRVVVWDERQPAQKQAYPNFLGNQIAAHLAKQDGLTVKSVSIDDTQQGLSDEVINACDVLVWWGHVRQAEITPETGRKLVKRIVEGSLSLVAIHSAHWSTPFVEAMNERSRRDVARIYGAEDGGKLEITEVPPPQRYTLPKRTDRLTPWSTIRKFPDGSRKVELHLPYCVFPGFRGDGKPSHVRVLKPDHPIAAGVPRSFTISKTEMYDEPFHVPEPDVVILEECWEPGEWFRSGMLWELGKGKVFYFRPGHETYPVFFEEAPLRIITNATRWLGQR